MQHGQKHSKRTHRPGAPRPDRLLNVGERASTVASSVCGKKVGGDAHAGEAH